MAKTYKTYLPDQDLLLPPSVHTENSIQRFPVKCHIVTSRSPS